MIVYHGSTDKIVKPSVSCSKKYLDFGRGFYVTAYKSQAERWALRKGLRQEKPAIVNLYELKSLEGVRTLAFGEENEAWLDFVCECRRGSDIYQNYDVITGKVADDDVFKTVDMYFRGLWEKEKALEELRYCKANNQMCFVNQSVLDKVLVFKDSYEVIEKNV